MVPTPCTKLHDAISFTYFRARCSLSVSNFFGTAPTRVSTSSPFLNNIKVGIDRTLYVDGTFSTPGSSVLICVQTTRVSCPASRDYPLSTGLRSCETLAILLGITWTISILPTNSSSTSASTGFNICQSQQPKPSFFAMCDTAPTELPDLWGQGDTCERAHTLHGPHHGAQNETRVGTAQNAL
jgi:hypothetical protein